MVITNSLVCHGRLSIERLAAWLVTLLMILSVPASLLIVLTQHTNDILWLQSGTRMVIPAADNTYPRLDSTNIGLY